MISHDRLKVHPLSLCDRIEDKVEMLVREQSRTSIQDVCEMEKDVNIRLSVLISQRTRKSEARNVKREG